MAASKAKPISTKNLMALLILAMLLAVGATAFGGKIMADIIIRESKVAAAKLEARANLDADLKAAPDLVNNYRRLETTGRLISDALPNKADFPGLVAMTDNIANSTSVSLKSITPLLSGGAVVPVAAAATSAAATSASASQAPPPQYFVFTMALEASYQNLRNFLAALERAGRPISITALQVSGRGNALTIQIQATAAYQGEATLPFKTKVIK